MTLRFWKSPQARQYERNFLVVRERDFRRVGRTVRSVVVRWKAISEKSSNGRAERKSVCGTRWDILLRLEFGEG